MASLPFPQIWQQPSYTGNSQFVVDSNGNLWMAANSDSYGVTLYTSSDYGCNWVSVLTSDVDPSHSVPFNPVITIDSGDVLHIVGQIATSSSPLSPTALFLFHWDIPSNNLTPGSSIYLEDGITALSYDIACLANGTLYIPVAVTTAVSTELLGIEVTSPSFSITKVISIQSLTSGYLIQGVSCWTADGITVEIYYTSAPKLFTFKPDTITLMQVNRVGGVLGTPSAITTFSATFASSKLTVIGNGTLRYLLQPFYTQAGLNLVASVLLGYLNGTWGFQVFTGTVNASLNEPVLSLSPSSPTGVVLAYINGSVSGLAAGATMSIFDLYTSPWALQPRVDFPYPGLATWLRGSKSLLPELMPWGFVADAAGVGRFYTGFNAAPVPSISPQYQVCLRGVPYTYDASGSTDINDDTLQFSWTLTNSSGGILTTSGTTATVTLPLSAGPAAQNLILTVYVVDLDNSGVPRRAPVTDAVVLSYPEIAAPVVVSTAQNAGRNSVVTITPDITVSPYTVPTYSWAQLPQNTIVQVIGPSDEETLTISTSGVLVAGERIIFLLTVDDGLNPPAYEYCSVTVAARAATSETLYLRTLTRGGNISQRNTQEPWSAAITSLLTGFTTSKRAPVLGFQSGSHIFIGPESVLVKRGGYTYHVYPADTTVTIIDAVHSDLDQVCILTSDMQILRVSQGNRDTDWVDASIILSSISPNTFYAITATPPFAGQRIFVLSGPNGVLLLQVDDFFNVNGSLELSRVLYGASMVQFVRLLNVESLHSGTLLIGTVDANGNNYETEYNLANRSVIHTWDSSDLLNQVVDTAEFLFEPVDTYSGEPTPPVMLTPVLAATGVLLSWEQQRPDLVSGYQVTVVGYPPLSQTAPYVINNGMQMSYTVTGLPSNHTYTFSVLAYSLDGESAASNTVNITI